MPSHRSQRWSLAPFGQPSGTGSPSSPRDTIDSSKSARSKRRSVRGATNHALRTESFCGNCGVETKRGTSMRELCNRPRIPKGSSKLRKADASAAQSDLAQLSSRRRHNVGTPLLKQPGNRRNYRIGSPRAGAKFNQSSKTVALSVIATRLGLSILYRGRRPFRSARSASTAFGKRSHKSGISQP